MVSLLVQNPLLLLFAVAAVGYFAGQLRVAGFSLGVAAVLFAGLGAGALHPDLKLPEIVQYFGLVLFVYSVGLSSGPGFFGSFRKRGLRDNALALGVVSVSAALTAALGSVLGLGGALTAGLYAGALTNTPALASVLEALASAAPDVKAQPVIAYSVAYPGGVIGVILAMWIAQRVWKIDYDAEPLSRHDAAAVTRSLENLTARVDRRLTRDEALAALRARDVDVIFGRTKHGEAVSLVTDQTVFEPGDLVTLVGRSEDLARAAAELGAASDRRIDLDREVLDFRRIFVSNAGVTERPLAALHLTERLGAIVTRVRRGDVELLPHGDMELELGDRVRVVAPREKMADVAKYFGDSYRALAEIDVITFGVGVALGLLVGAIPIPLPGGASFKLGYAGGPLVVGLLLGRLGRTGRLVWTLPFSANLTLRQLGLVLFLAGVGTRSGQAFASTLRSGGGLTLLAAGALVTGAAALGSLWIGRKWLKIPMARLVGMVAGIHTQPAALAFGSQQTKNDLPNVGYATVYPIATIAKIVLAGVLLVLLR